MLQIDFEGLCNANFLNYVTVAYQNHCYHWLEVEEREGGGGIVVMDLGAHSVRVWCSLASLA